MIPSAKKEYYGDETRWFIGRVISVNDPLKLGRVQVRIYGIHPESTGDVSTGDLPWASVSVPITEGGSSGIGTVVGLKPMAQVFGIFLDGKNSQLPLVIGSIPKFESDDERIKNTGTTVGDQNESYDQGNSPTKKNTIPKSNIDEVFLEGGTNAEKAYNFFLRLKYPSHVCAGIVGNLLIESGPDDIDPTKGSTVPGEGSWGIAQWNPSAAAGDRLSNLRAYCSNANLPEDSLYGQLSFIRYELEEVPEDFGYRPLLAAQDIEEATRVFEEKYEKPQPGSFPDRLEKAREIFDIMET